MKAPRDVVYLWDKEKNQKLVRDRGVSFEQIVFHLEQGHLVKISPGQGKYAHQKQFLVEVNRYIYIVPYVKEGADGVFLKTIIPSRKMTKQFLGGIRHGEA
ncbi:MAG: BrnT family toxin [Candidatus Omnitrophica bacterium]|nr:BrnT family toxin [Candidatus Omnitrophota bacterium]